MTTDLDEIAPGIYRLSTLVPDIGPDGFTFNQFLVGNGPALTTDDIVDPAMEAEANVPQHLARPRHLSCHAVPRRSGADHPRPDAGSSFSGDGARALNDLADSYESVYLTPS
jgi:hypothetical protein